MDRPSRTVLLGQLVEAEIRTATTEMDNLDGRFVVHCDEALSAKIMEHAVRFKHTEVFGLLLGEVFRTPTGRLRTIIRDFMAAERLHTSTATFVEVSAEELIRMDNKCEPLMERSGLLKVGWFHTHPGHGIFMSQTDKDNHAMYSKPWQVALVLDPVRRSIGFFSGPNCERILHLEGLPQSPEASPRPADSSPRSPTLPSSEPAVQHYSNGPKHREWIVVGIIFQLGLLYYAIAAHHMASSALHRLADVDKRLKVLEGELIALRAHDHALAQKTVPKVDR